MNIPQTGPNKQKQKFFEEVSDAFKFLAIFHSLSAESQLELMEHITVLQAKEASS